MGRLPLPRPIRPRIPRACGAPEAVTVRRDGPRPSLTSLDGFHDLLCGIVEIVGGHPVETAVADDLLALLDVGAFEAHYQRHLQADLLHRGDHAFGDDVALHDAAEDVDQNALHLRIGGDDLNADATFSLVAL